MEDPNKVAEELMGGAPKPLLTDKEIADAKAKARAKVDAALKKAAFDRVVEEEELRIKREEGRRTGVADMDEPVSIMIDLPEFCTDIRVNMEPFYHGRSYTVARHIANSLREIMQRTWTHQAILDGKDLKQQYQQARPMLLTPTGVSPLSEAA